MVGWLQSLSKNKKLIGVPQSELEKKAIVTFRKHLSWYFKSNKIGKEIHGIKEWRARLVRINSYEELEELMKEFVQMMK